MRQVGCCKTPLDGGSGSIASLLSRPLPPVRSPTLLPGIHHRYAPKGIRIPVAALKGRCPSPLDDGGQCQSYCIRNGSVGQIAPPPWVRDLARTIRGAPRAPGPRDKTGVCHTR